MPFGIFRVIPRVPNHIKKIGYEKFGKNELGDCSKYYKCSVHTRDVSDLPKK